MDLKACSDWLAGQPVCIRCELHAKRKKRCFSIPYPFGIGNRSCFKEPSHELVCDESYVPLMLFLGEQALTASSRQQHLKVNIPSLIPETNSQLLVVIRRPSCLISRVGFFRVDAFPCAGMCPTLLMDLVPQPTTTTQAWDFNPCCYAFLAQQDWFDLTVSHLWNFTNNTGLNFKGFASSPVVLDWVVGLETCEEAKKNSTAYSCGENSFCSDSPNGPGYRCHYNQGYQGNPYLPQGCQEQMMVHKMEFDAYLCIKVFLF
ncbi:hypothetical protein SLEP1_g41868 [Rubroshorea leprosula]|uniref:Wall-associated receptor kinase galacturonan-binding domain-containing protein n=1 Tax=Rubroshorea leprosula TaxID=152421 RepID=A0AAV5L8E0_9ROSI|nr:hypothetical protein SLEP1_g41868 [Rubroshorea leprosula]